MALLVAGGVALVVLALCVAGGLYVIGGSPPIRTDAAGRVEPTDRFAPAALPSAAIPGVSFRRLVTSLHDITGVHTTYSVMLRDKGGFDEGVTDPGAGIVLLVSARAADPSDGVNSASCQYTDHDSGLTVDAAMTDVVRRCALAALPPAQDASAVAWL
ncbi:MAG TPA: hypothetical protein VGJ07_20505, partial [Rugosimonospora sp.]